MAVRTSQSEAEAGYYAVSGVRTMCPAGTYGSSTGLTSDACDGNCTAGYRCAAGSSSGTATPCGEGLTYPASVYCEAGASNYTTLSDDSLYYTTPTTNPENQREFYAACPDDSYCANGLKYDYIEWLTCPSSSIGEMSTEISIP